jgi:hypothetical protein
MVNRFAVLLSAVFALAAALIAFLPANSNGTNCGVWMSPSFNESEAQATYDRNVGGRGEEALADERANLASTIEDTREGCGNALDRRRFWTLLAFGAALVATPAVLTVAGVDA